MKHKLILLVAAAHLAATGAAYAQQQPFGRDSVYAIPGKPTTPLPPTAEPIHRSGRDSLYVTQIKRPLSPPSPPESAQASGPVRYGRDSIYSYGSPNPPAASPTEVGSSKRGSGGG
jgi:hypothetical protein